MVYSEIFPIYSAFYAIYSENLRIYSAILLCSHIADKAHSGMREEKLRLLSEKSVELEIIDSIAHMQVGRIRKKRT